ncbi:MAG TPA: hypothetical protein VFV33_13215 [Gemmatimonadaceae bacterium]|nr:hypothetical protein [Gemmatimonadaceae bacterium]
MTATSYRALAAEPRGIAGQLDCADERALSLTRGLTEGQANWRAQATHPSVCEALAGYVDWLRRAVPVLREGVHGVRSGWRARLGMVGSGWWWQLVPGVVEWAPALPRLGSRARDESARRPVRAVMAEVLALHAEVRQLAREGERRDLRIAQVRLPGVGVVRPPLDVALAVVPAMARRALRRAERVRLDAGFPCR